MKELIEKLERKKGWLPSADFDPATWVAGIDAAIQTVRQHETARSASAPENPRDCSRCGLTAHGGPHVCREVEPASVPEDVVERVAEAIKRKHNQSFEVQARAALAAIGYPTTPHHEGDSQ